MVCLFFKDLLVFPIMRKDILTFDIYSDPSFLGDSFPRFKFQTFPQQCYFNTKLFFINGAIYSCSYMKITTICQNFPYSRFLEFYSFILSLVITWPRYITMFPTSLFLVSNTFLPVFVSGFGNFVCKLLLFTLAIF